MKCQIIGVLGQVFRLNKIRLCHASHVGYAQEIGAMDPNDPLRSERIKELHALTELGKSTKAEHNKFIYDKMDALASDVGSLKPRDSRRADIVNEIIRLSHLILK